MYEKEKIKKNPYNFICDYAESLYPHVGRKVFEILALLPTSLIIPDIPFGAKKIRSNLNAIFLAPSGSGKTSIAKLFANFVVNPIEIESVTSVGLEETISQAPIFSLIVGDFARMSSHPDLMKLLEGILGEEKRIQRRTARKDIDIDVNGIALLCGVASDLSKYIMSGMIWRLVPILISHDQQAHSDIGFHIKNKVGEEEEENREEIIKEFYLDLARRQSGENKITGYKIKQEFKDGLCDEWDKLSTQYVKNLGINFFREELDGFRFLLAHAFLNIENREVENGRLIPNREDYEVALKLMKQSIKFKLRLIRSQSMAKGLKDLKDFKKLLEDDKIPEETKQIIKNLVDIKGDKIKPKSF